MAVISSTHKMICPRCGAEMNHHADKLLRIVESEAGGEIDFSLGGVLEEFHTCPNCGYSDSRHA